MKVTIENMFHKIIPQYDQTYQNIIFGVSQYVIWARKKEWNREYSFYIFTKNRLYGRWYEDVPKIITQEFLDTHKIGILREFSKGYSGTSSEELSALDNPSNVIESSSLPKWFVEMIIMEKLKE